MRSLIRPAKTPSMTRVKKTRSLKRIHGGVKTGSVSKLKKAAGNDRQVGKRVKGRRTLSAYEKFLLENPDASEAAKAAQKAAEKAAEKKAEGKTAAQDDAQAARQRSEKPERSKSLFDQLDSKDLDGIY